MSPAPLPMLMAVLLTTVPGSAGGHSTIDLIDRHTPPGPSTHQRTAPELPAHQRTAPAPSTHQLTAPAPSARWDWPLVGRPHVLRGFAPPAQPWLAGHRGIDLAAPPGTEVRAAGAGTVGYAGPLAERGVVTVLHADGLRTTYLPVQPSVRHGQTVGRGEAIGVVQDVPGHCPVACLHWGLLRDRLYLDPLLLLGRGQVRLLPVWPTHREPADHP
ncbi:murein hydrolase activator EnvC family protein [Streptosporangium roseum]|uniref:murein hydrolase activator EnvC family protein n=1 Tax=Streptosporangium roseum TaxID=2001 RepID=UPI001E4FC2B3|nr:peptidoglycan DD-metalloendopeptidase family protein [Streptosporangium roseum]